MRVYLERRAKLFFSPALNVKVPFSSSSSPADRAQVGVALPFSVAIKVTEPVSIGVGTSLNIYDLEYAANSMFIPLHVGMTFSAAGKVGPILDINPYFAWPYLFHPANNGRMVSATGASVDVPAVNPGTYTAGLSLSFYLYL